MPSDVFYQLQYAAQNSDYWINHNARTSLREVRRQREEILADERKRGTGTRWRIVRYQGRIHDRAKA